MILINSPKNEFVSVLHHHCGRHGAEAAAIFNNGAEIRNHTLDYQNRRTDSVSTVLDKLINREFAMQNGG